MTQPVLLFSQRLGQRLAAEACGIGCEVYVIQQGACLELASRLGVQRLELPAAAPPRHFADAATAQAWRDVALELARRFPGAMLLLDLDHPLLVLGLLAWRYAGLDYALRSHGGGRALQPWMQAVLANARGVICADAADEAAFMARHVWPLAVVHAKGDSAALREAVAGLPQRQPAAAPPCTQEAPLRVLLVSYYAGPCRTVGVQRVNYWFEELAGLGAGAMEVHLATAVPPWPGVAGVHHVPDCNDCSLWFESGWSPAACANRVARGERLRKSLNMQSFYWPVALENYFEAPELRHLHYDVVCFSGNPFWPFEFAIYVKKRWNARVVLDYRDPMANCPDMPRSPEALAVAQHEERGLNHVADLLVTVNEACVELLENPGDKEVAVVPNGCDERLTEPLRRQAPPRPWMDFIHAGKFYARRSPAILLGALSRRGLLLHHLGPPPALETEAASLVLHGVLPNEEALRRMSSARFGVVFVSEEQFETPVKLLDYLGLGLEVLLLYTPGRRAVLEQGVTPEQSDIPGPSVFHEPSVFPEPSVFHEQGSLAGEGHLRRVLAGRPDIHWVANEAAAIDAFLQTHFPRQSETAPHWWGETLPAAAAQRKAAPPPLMTRRTASIELARHLERLASARQERSVEKTQKHLDTPPPELI